MPLRRILSATLFAFAATGAQATDMASTNYRIQWDVADTGGGLMTSPNYVLTDSVGQSSAIGQSMSASYTLQAGFHAPPDTDGDIVKDFMDNCIEDANPDQRDSNADGYGNRCDADLNNDGIVNPIDLGLMRLAFFTTDADADFNGDGIVNPIDLGIMRLFFFGPPGPSGLD